MNQTHENYVQWKTDLGKEKSHLIIQTRLLRSCNNGEKVLANPNVACMVCSDKEICECEGAELRKVVENCQER